LPSSKFYLYYNSIYCNQCQHLIMVVPVGVEPTTCPLEVGCSIQLS
jgi:hypothetical protein